MALEIDGVIYRVGKNQHVKPGKGGAYVQVRLITAFCCEDLCFGACGMARECSVLLSTTLLQVELKEIKSGAKVNRRFRAAETVNKAPLGPDEQFQFLYFNGDHLVIMHNTTFDQVRCGSLKLAETTWSQWCTVLLAVFVRRWRLSAAFSRVANSSFCRRA